MIAVHIVSSLLEKDVITVSEQHALGQVVEESGCCNLKRKATEQACKYNTVLLQREAGNIPSDCFSLVRIVRHLA